MYTTGLIVFRETLEAALFIGIMAAAVADYRPKRLATDKLKKTESGVPVIDLEINPDILADVASLPAA